MGSGLGSVSHLDLLASISSMFSVAATARLAIDARAVPLTAVESAWSAEGRARIVFTI
jgi:hypothetical protein